MTIIARIFFLKLKYRNYMIESCEVAIRITGVDTLCTNNNKISFTPKVANFAKTKFWKLIHDWLTSYDRGKSLICGGLG